MRKILPTLLPLLSVVATLSLWGALGSVLSVVFLCVNWHAIHPPSTQMVATFAVTGSILGVFIGFVRMAVSCVEAGIMSSVAARRTRPAFSTSASASSDGI